MRIFIVFILILCHSLAYGFTIELKEVVWFDSEFKLSEESILYVSREFMAEKDVFAKLIKETADHLNKISPKETVVTEDDDIKKIKNGIIIGYASTPLIKNLLRKNNLSINDEEDYALIVKEDYFLIALGSKKAFSYAISTAEELILMSHIKILGKKIYLSVPSVKIYDSPSFKIRAVHITLFDTLDLDRIKHVIDMASERRFNTIIVVVNNGIKYDKHPEISKPNAFSKDSLKELIRYANQKNMEVIPEINLLSHQEWLLGPAYPDFILPYRERGSPNMFLTYDPRKPEVYKIIFDILDEIIEIFEPKYIHIGHDEAFGLRMFDEPQSYQFFAEHIDTIYKHIKSKNEKIKIIMWGDMLIKEHNGGYKNIYKAIDFIPKDIIIVIWYFPKGDFSIIDNLISKGFHVMISIFKNEKMILKCVDYIKKSNLKSAGMIATTWYYLPWNKMKMVERIIDRAGIMYW